MCHLLIKNILHLLPNNFMIFQCQLRFTAVSQNNKNETAVYFCLIFVCVM